MVATCKADLIKVTEFEYEKLIRQIAGLETAVAMAPREDNISIKDVIGHRAHWIDLFLGWYAEGQAGRKVFFPAKGYKWNDLKRYNADLRARQADLGWADAVTLLEHNHDRLFAFMTATSDTGLYGAPMRGAYNHWTAGRWAEAAGPSHYRSATKYIRAAVREDTRKGA